VTSIKYKYYLQNRKTGEIKVAWAKNPFGAKAAVAGNKMQILEWVATPAQRVKIVDLFRGVDPGKQEFADRIATYLKKCVGVSF